MKISIKLEKRIPNFNNEEMIKLAKETGDKDLKDKIIKNNMHFVVKLANKTLSNGSPEELDELVSMGMIGLLKAYDTYDHTKNIKFTTYMAKVVNREFSANARAKGMKCRSKYTSISMDNNLYKDNSGDSEKLLSEVLSDESHLDLVAVEDSIFDGVLNGYIERKLTSNEKIFARKYFFEGMSVSDIGRDMNVTRQRAHQHFKNSVRKLAPAFA
ncbi:sigma-70 family RNA polymerase sigma factor [Paenibacillus sp. 1781tsa1]|uniref:sigma-70 family RNA polymerase sigma factor n=1 Tax=Paenibacillus sp. 1781tsa1 TaxID=2953810 RepID=UPI0020A03BE9|nr:sigma-70 family RNA polymerase sigma factor [Paenibacillus sp. 1781tsa1]MCP1184907.1 sigma-70 family RNA polymerase sigma factor [Paenibacillus sp. 1781tsa1]